MGGWGWGSRLGIVVDNAFFLPPSDRATVSPRPHHHHTVDLIRILDVVLRRVALSARRRHSCRCTVWKKDSQRRLVCGEGECVAHHLHKPPWNSHSHCVGIQLLEVPDTTPRGGEKSPATLAVAKCRDPQRIESNGRGFASNVTANFQRSQLAIGEHGVSLEVRTVRPVHAVTTGRHASRG